MTEGERKPKRIVKLGPFELWGKPRREPNEFTRFRDSMRALLRVLPFIGRMVPEDDQGEAKP